MMCSCANTDILVIHAMQAAARRNCILLRRFLRRLKSKACGFHE